jgi:hypothetical protein
MTFHALGIIIMMLIRLELLMFKPKCHRCDFFQNVHDPNNELKQIGLISSSLSNPNAMPMS